MKVPSITTFVKALDNIIAKHEVSLIILQCGLETWAMYICRGSDQWLDTIYSGCASTEDVHHSKWAWPSSNSLHISSLVFISCLALELQSIRSKFRHSYMFGKEYVFSDLSPCWFLDAVLGEFSTALGSSQTVLLHVVALLILSDIDSCWSSLTLFSTIIYCLKALLFIAWKHWNYHSYRSTNQQN